MKSDAELMNDFFDTNHYEPTVDWRDPKYAALAKADVSDEPRDDHGRWTVGGDSTANGTSTSETLDPTAYRGEDYANGVKSVAIDVANKLGYPTDNLKIDLGYKYFQLNGQTYQYAGAANLKTGEITLYPKNISGVKDAEGVMAHEVGHQVFQTMLDQSSTDLRYINNEPFVDVKRDDGTSRMMNPMKPDGSLREGFGLEEKYPAYAAMTPFANNYKKLQEEDGVSQYSRDWWKAYNDGTATAQQAQHETFAEITRIVYESKRDTGKMWASDEAKGIGKTWKSYYTAVNRGYKQYKASRDE